MNLNVKIQDHDFKLNIGSGHNDWTWLSHYAARKFSKISYPQGTYLPAQLYILDKENTKLYPHPRQKIATFLQENKLSYNNITVFVKIRKGSHMASDFQKVWENEAFGLERMMMNVQYSIDTEKYKNKQGQKEFYFKVLLNYTMHSDIKHFFNQKKYVSPIQIQLQQRRIDNKLTNFKGHTKMPFSDVIPQLYYCSKDPKDPSSFKSQKIKDAELKNDVFKISMVITPKYVSIQQQNQIVAEQMRISQNIAKSLQQKQMQAKKRSANSSLCCYNFEQFWKLLQQHHGSELLIQNYDKSTKDRLKITLDKYLNDLYEIFFYYFIIENQSKQKKQQLGITYQHVMHFLRFYQIFSDLKSLNGFLQYYNSDFKFQNIKDTVDIEKKPVKFVQFVAILLRALQFIQTQTFTVHQETFDYSVDKKIKQIIQIDSEQQQFGEFKRNIRQNPKIISFYRNSSQQLKQIFVNQIIRSTQKASDKYVLMKQQFKSLLQISGLTTKNTDGIVKDMFDQLNLSEEGIFYYQFIQAMQWLALALVSSQKDGNDIQNQQEQALLIIQKIKFFMQKVQL